MKPVWLAVSFIPRWALEIVLWLSYILWAVFDFGSRSLAGPRTATRGCLGCLLGIPLFFVYFALTIVFAPFFVLYALIGRVDIATESATRLEVAQAAFYWPHIILYWLVPKLYRVDIGGPVEGLLGTTPTATYLLRDLDTDETAFVQPGAKAVEMVADEEQPSERRE